MPIKDPFSYSARWDSIGLDCSNCVYFSGPDTWPDTKKVSLCSFHHLSLSFQLQSDGYKQGEWFCKEFKDNSAYKSALNELESVRESLEAQVVYGGHGDDGFLQEMPFESIKKG